MWIRRRSHVARRRGTIVRRSLRIISRRRARYFR